MFKILLLFQIIFKNYRLCIGFHPKNQKSAQLGEIIRYNSTFALKIGMIFKHTERKPYKKHYLMRINLFQIFRWNVGEKVVG